jgi:alanine or glycine:cation symporter, AGCS family
MDSLTALLGNIEGWVWGWPLVILLFGTHIFLTIRLGFIQKFIGHAIKLSLTKDVGAQGDISHFGSLATALAATVGTGNIFGVAGAILVGGPGAVLWMWLTGVLGIATKYTEALLSVKYRVETDRGTMAGGPMYVLERGMRMKWLGVVFAVFTALAAFGIGNMVQSNAIAEILSDQFGLSHWITGVVLMVLTAAVILGGIRPIANVCQILVPFMAILYVCGCIVLLVINAKHIPESISLIIEGAFSGTAAIGGFAGAAIKAAVTKGIARGLFSNEAGLGSAPIVAAAAKTNNPVRQALVSSTGTFWDTVVVCAFTGLAFVSSGGWMAEGVEEASDLSKFAFDQIPYVGKYILVFGVLTFVFSTILGWSYYGEKAMEYLFGTKSIFPYRLAWIVAVLVGTLMHLNAVWAFSGILNGLMAIPNLISLLALSGVAALETGKYASDLRGRKHRQG